METDIVYLVDTNIFLEITLEQEKNQIARLFFQSNDLNDIFASDLSLHSIGIMLFRMQKVEPFIQLVTELFISGINIISLPASKYIDIKDASKNYKLDFEDTYQYVLAKHNDLTLISFDKDFDRTDLKRKEPSEFIH